MPPRLPLGDTWRTHEKSLAQDVAEDVLGAAKDGNVKLFIVKVFILPIVTCQIVKVFIIILSIVICQRRIPRQACP